MQCSQAAEKTNGNAIRMGSTGRRAARGVARKRRCDSPFESADRGALSARCQRGHAGRGTNPGPALPGDALHSGQRTDSSTGRFENEVKREHRPNSDSRTVSRIRSTFAGSLVRRSRSAERTYGREIETESAIKRSILDESGIDCLMRSRLSRWPQFSGVSSVILGGPNQ
jgi:hypothetical protein